MVEFIYMMIQNIFTKMFRNILHCMETNGYMYKTQQNHIKNQVTEGLDFLEQIVLQVRKDTKNYSILGTKLLANKLSWKSDYTKQIKKNTDTLKNKVYSVINSLDTYIESIKNQNNIYIHTSFKNNVQGYSPANMYTKFNTYYDKYKAQDTSQLSQDLYLVYEACIMFDDVVNEKNIIQKIQSNLCDKNKITNVPVTIKHYHDKKKKIFYINLCFYYQDMFYGITVNTFHNVHENVDLKVRKLLKTPGDMENYILKLREQQKAIEEQKQKEEELRKQKEELRKQKEKEEQEQKAKEKEEKIKKQKQ